MSWTRGDYFEALCKELSIPTTHHTRVFLGSVSQAEHGVDLHTREAHFNPFNTTKRIPGSSTVPGNTAGVQDYGSFYDGVYAAAATLRERPYSNVLADLRHNVPPSQLIETWNRTPWGTAPQLLRDVLPYVQQNLNHVLDRLLT